MFINQLSVCALILITSLVHISAGLTTRLLDTIAFKVITTKLSSLKWSSVVHVDSTAPIYPDLSVGHFKLQIVAHSENTFYNGTSDCINIKSKSVTNINSIAVSKFGRFLSHGIYEFVDYNYEVSLRNLFATTTKISIDESNTSHTTFRYSFSSLDSTLVYLNISLTQNGCDTPRTLGKWSDPWKWDNHKVPSVGDSVMLSEGTGVISMDGNVTVRSLLVKGGLLQNHATSCPDGWSIDPRGRIGIKCYKLQLDPKPFVEAEANCHSLGFGTADAHLLQIRDREELLTAMRICRGTKGSIAFQSGCWIGMHDPSGTGDFDWVNPLYVGGLPTSLFLDWHRGEPNNHTVSEGNPTNGELCAALTPWQEDPLVQEQGSWNDEACTLSKPYICQIFGQTERFTLTTTGNVTLSDGAMEGGYLVLGSGASHILDFTLTSSAQIKISNASSKSVITRLQLEDGSALVVDSPSALLTDSSVVGEGARSASSTGMQPYITVSADTKISTMSSANVTFNARLFLLGSLQIGESSTVVLKQGGEMSEGSVELGSASSSLRLSGYGARLSSYDAFQLVAGNRGPFIGEFYDNSTLEEANEHLLQVRGVYRLAVHHTNSFGVHIGQPNVTSCIPFNATESELAEALNAMPMVRDRGGVTVRRYGKQTSARFLFGFTYRVEMDAPQTDRFLERAVDLDLNCYGLSNCGCSETKVPLVDVNGNAECPVSTGGFSQVDSSACVHPPTLTVARISTLSYLATKGKGQLTIDSGVHRLPPVSAVAITAEAGTGVVGADVITWFAIGASLVGRLIVTGTGWDAWDSSTYLYAPVWTTERGLVSVLGSTPPVSMTATHFSLTDMGSILVASPRSNLTWTNGSWGGGILGGRATVFVTTRLRAVGSGKALRYGATLFIKEGATMEWSSGNISLSDGADIIVEGALLVSSKTDIFIGEAQLLTAPTVDVSAWALLKEASGRDFHGYYGDELPAELRGGWYQDPLCGDQCALTNQLLVRESANVTIASRTNVTFSLPLNLIGLSRLIIDTNVQITLASGGTCGNQVKIDIGQLTVLELSGGEMSMEARCTIRGEGELIVSAGSHNSAFSIDAHITISGGTLLWPMSRGTDQSLTFNGGLLMDKTGQLSVEPFSTTILVYKEVVLRDQCEIRFPLIGIAAQASPFDAQDAPDSSPRGKFIATDDMLWQGGTIIGKADFNANKALFLNGETKYIRSLAKLVNKGHCEWGSGDLLFEDQGDFLNLGTLQMQGALAEDFSSSAMYKGTELPVVNGGDVFALDYHTYDMDIGGLSYNDYVQLRTEFVSRAPDGWAAAEDI